MTARFLLVVSTAVALAGCGLRPMYAGGESGAVAHGLRSVSVQAIPGRAGWLVRKELVSRLGAANGAAAYRLEVELDDDITAYGIRGDRAAIEGDTGATILVGGNTASNIDVSAKLSSALPVFLIVVVGLAFLLLTFAFRTFLVPLKSVLGFRQFLLRGLDQVRGEWNLVTMAWNLKRMFALIPAT